MATRHAALLHSVELQWTCGVVAPAMCVHCYMELARKAHELASENLRLRELLDKQQGAA